MMYTNKVLAEQQSALIWGVFMTKKCKQRIGKLKTNINVYILYSVYLYYNFKKT